MELNNQFTPQTPTKSNKKFIIPIITLGIIVAGLTGFIVYEQFIKTPDKTETTKNESASQNQPSNNDTSDTANQNGGSDETTGGEQPANNSLELSQDNPSKNPDGTTASNREARDRIDKANNQYPAYKNITKIVDSLDFDIIKHGNYADTQSVFNDLVSEEVVNAIRVIHSVFGVSYFFQAAEVDAALTAIFGPQDIRKALTQNGYISYNNDNGRYENVGGIGDGCEPASFMSNIAREDGVVILTYSYLEASPTGCGDLGDITHQIIVTITNDGTNRIQKIDVNPVSQ